MTKRRHSTFEMRRQAVHQVLNENKPVRVIAEELGYNPDTIYNWLHRFKDKGEEGLKDSAKSIKSQDQRSQDDAKRIKELEKKLKEKEEENEILKKFQAFLKENE